jgi:ABC-2 type transport system ATP-binding protein
VDEPFSGLDPLNTRLVKQIIQEQADAGRTVVMSTHQMYQVEAMCNRIVLIDRGHSVLYGRVDEIKRRFAGHAVSVTGSGDFASVPGVLEARPPGENGAWHLALQPGAEPRELLRTLACRSDMSIERFEIAEASLDDIFITIVQGQRGEAADA